MTKDALKAYGAVDMEGLLAKAMPTLEHRRALYKRYARKSDPNKLMGSAPERSCVPFEYYIVNMAQGYLAGKAPAYNVLRHEQGEDYVKAFTDEIARVRGYNDDAATYMELMHDYLITTAAYLYVYENEANEIVYTSFDSRQTVGIFDYGTPANLIGVMRTWTEAGLNDSVVRVVEVITDERRATYRDTGAGFQEAGDGEALAWGDVPCVAFEEEDGIAVFEPALAEIDAYEQAEKNLRSMTQYNDAAKLLIVGYQAQHDLTTTDANGNVIKNPARAAEEAAWMQALSLFVGEGGDVRWLLKNIDYTGLLEVQRNRHDKITMLTGVPNMTDEAFASADNASALGYKLYALDQYSATTDRVFRKGLLRLWELIAGRLNLKGSGFDFRDVQITMQRNIPTDRDKSIDRAVKMRNSGLFSAETCINESSVEVDAAEELEKVTAEEQADYDRMMERAETMPTAPPEDGEDK